MPHSSDPAPLDARFSRGADGTVRGRLRVTPKTVSIAAALAGASGGTIAVIYRTGASLPEPVLAALAVAVLVGAAIVDARRRQDMADHRCREEISDLRAECRADRDRILDELRTALVDKDRTQENRIRDLRKVATQLEQTSGAASAAALESRAEIEALRHTVSGLADTVAKIQRKGADTGA